MHGKDPEAHVIVSHFTVLTKLTVIGRKVQLQPQLDDTSAGHHIPIWISSCQTVPVINELLKADEEVRLRPFRGGESGRVQLKMHLERPT